MVLGDGQEVELSVRKGRNKNILVQVSNAAAAAALADISAPFSIFSPGLAGVARNETHVSDGVLLRALARGDANVVLRNILYRLWDTPEWDAFVTDIQTIFPDLDIKVRFDAATDENIGVHVIHGKNELPIELAGTGVLQAAQILAYIHKFSPSMIVLDEPDSHLHPNNQRLICRLLRHISGERETQVILTTHSRHIIDAIGHDSTFLWAQSGRIERASDEDEIDMLLDLGALDVKDRIAAGDYKLIVLTEDDNLTPILTLLEANGSVADKTLVLSYGGVTSIKQLRPLMKVVRDTNKDAVVVLHRDRDLLTDEDVRNWREKVNVLGAIPFLTGGLDIELYFLREEHLATSKQIDRSDIVDLLNKTIDERFGALVRSYVNKTIENERKQGRFGNLDVGKVAADAPLAIRANLDRFALGKELLAGFRDAFRKRYGKSSRIMVATAALEDASVRHFVAAAFPEKG